MVDGQTVLLEKDISETDRFGRLLRYVYLDSRTMANAALVEAGLARVSTFPPDVKYMELLIELEQNAQASGVGMWAEMEGVFNEPIIGDPGLGDCELAYPDICIPSPPPDLNCGEVPFRRFTVLPPDPHNFDGDRDGVGCES